MKILSLGAFLVSGPSPDSTPEVARHPCFKDPDPDHFLTISMDFKIHLVAQIIHLTGLAS